MPEQDTKPVNRYLPPRARKGPPPQEASGTSEDRAPRMLDHSSGDRDGAGLIARWIDRALST